MQKTIVVLLLCICLCGCFEKEWYVVKTGTMERVEYLQSSWNASDKTIIHFTDGSTYMLYGTHNIPSKEITIERASGENARIRRK